MDMGTSGEQAIGYIKIKKNVPTLTTPESSSGFNTETELFASLEKYNNLIVNLLEKI